MRRVFAGLAMMIALGGGAVGVVVTQDEGGGEAMAQLWVDIDGGTCSRSSSPAEYADAAACSSFQSAYNAASCGDAVKVKAGSYAGQLVTYSSGKADTCQASPVVIEAAEGETVTLLDSSVDSKSLQFGRANGSSMGPRDITFRGLTLEDEFYAYPGTRRLRIEGTTGAKFFMRCAHDLTLAGNTWTDPEASAVPTIGPADTITIHADAADVCPSSSTAPSGVLIDGDLFFRIWRPDGSSAHRECLHIMGADGLTIRGSRFHECLGNTAAVSLNEDGTTTMQGVLIENSSFWKTYDSGDCCPGPTGEGAAINIGGGGNCAETAEVTIRFNTLYLSGDFVEQACPTGAGIIIDSNVFLKAAPSCSSPMDQYVWRYNVAESGSWGASCDDGNNEVGAVSVVDRDAGDLHLSAGAFAVDQGNPTSPPATDFDGDARPAGSAPDAGMDEKE